MIHATEGTKPVGAAGPVKHTAVWRFLALRVNARSRSHSWVSPSWFGHLITKVIALVKPSVAVYTSVYQPRASTRIPSVMTCSFRPKHVSKGEAALFLSPNMFFFFVIYSLGSVFLHPRAKMLTLVYVPVPTLAEQNDARARRTSAATALMLLLGDFTRSSSACRWPLHTRAASPQLTSP